MRDYTKTSKIHTITQIFLKMFNEILINAEEILTIKSYLLLIINLRNIKFNNIVIKSH